jgi:hypothetical protein
MPEQVASMLNVLHVSIVFKYVYSLLMQSCSCLTRCVFMPEHVVYILNVQLHQQVAAYRICCIRGERACLVKGS